MAEAEIGRVTNYFSRIGVAVIELTGPLEIGDQIRVKGGDRDFQQEVESMQIEHQAIEKAGAGQEVAVKLDQRARPNDSVYKL
jgi:selenocysteine-specific translation elongation factor